MREICIQCRTTLLFLNDADLRNDLLSLPSHRRVRVELRIKFGESGAELRSESARVLGEAIGMQEMRYDRAQDRRSPQRGPAPKCFRVRPAPAVDLHHLSRGRHVGPPLVYIR